MMKKTIIVTIACTLIALLTFAQPGSKGTKTTAETITVTGTANIRSAIEEGAAANYQPAKTLVVRGTQNSNSPGRYVLNGPGHVVNKLGEIIQTGIKPGSRVRVYYANMGDLRMIDQCSRSGLSLARREYHK